MAGSRKTPRKSPKSGQTGAIDEVTENQNPRPDTTPEAAPPATPENGDNPPPRPPQAEAELAAASPSAPRMSERPSNDRDGEAATPPADQDAQTETETPDPAVDQSPPPDDPRTDAVAEADIAAAQHAPASTPPADPEGKESAPPNRQEAKGRRSALPGLILGGALAATAGFLAAQYADPKGWPFDDDVAVAAPVPDPSERLDAIDAALAGLRADLGRAEERATSAVADALAEATGGLEARLSEGLQDADARLATLGQALGALSDRVVELEKLPFDASETAASAVEAYRREVAELRALIEEVIARNDAFQAQIDDARAEAAQAEARAALREAVEQIEAAIRNGGGFAAALQTLTAAGAEVPQDIAAHAEAGVPTLATLQGAFAPAARAALDAALRDVEGLGAGERLMAFIRAQLGARSLAARDGDDADAILSRAEAALRDADIDNALAEIAALPDIARPHMSVWVATAETRRAALAALPVLAANIESF